MKSAVKHLLILAFAGFVLAGCATNQPGPCCSPAAKDGPKAQEWEYKTIYLGPTDPRAADKLNEAARGGWRLSALSPAGTTGGNDCVIFERPKQ